jgi:hypothetical protein
VESATGTYDLLEVIDSEPEIVSMGSGALESSDHTDEDMPSLQSVSDSESDCDSTDNRMPSLRTVSDSDAESECNSDVESDSGPPSLRSVSNSSDSGSEDTADLVYPGDDGETFEDRLKFWVHASKECCDIINNSVDPPNRARRLGDVLGNTVAALLEFF